MDFIRRQRFAPTYNPNTSHVLYGLVSFSFSSLNFLTQAGALKQNLALGRRFDHARLGNP